MIFLTSAAVIFGGCVLFVVGMIFNFIFPDSEFIDKAVIIGLSIMMIGALVFLGSVVLKAVLF